jgi:hypothetical protein
VKRDLRVLGALIVVAAALGLVPVGVASAQTCAPPAACNAPGATPLPPIPVVVESPAGSETARTNDVLARPPLETTSTVPSAAMAGGSLGLGITLGTIVRRRKLASVSEPQPASAMRRVRVRAGHVRHTGLEPRWDIEAVERAAAGVKQGR